MWRRARLYENVVFPSDATWLCSNARGTASADVAPEPCAAIAVDA